MENWQEQQPQKIEAKAGQNFYKFAKKLIDTASKTGTEVIGILNGIHLNVNPNSTVEDLNKNFWSTSLFKKLKRLNFSNYESVLDWLYDFEEINYLLDKEQVDQVISIFRNRGFDIGVNKDDDYDKNNAEDFAKFIIAQCLGEINKRKNFNLKIYSLRNEWEQKFGR